MSAPRVRVLFVIESLGRAGAEQALLGLTVALREQGVDSEVVALWPPYILAEAFEAQGIRVHRLDVGHRWNAAAVLWKLGRLQRDFDVVHAHLFFADLYVGLARGWARSTPRFVTFHNLAYQARPATTLFHRARKVLDGAAHRRLFDGLFAVSHAVAAHFKEELGLGQDVGVVPNPVHVASSTRSSRARFGWSEADFVLCFPGRFVAEKGHGDLLEGFRALRARGVPAKLLLVGGGPLLEDFREEVRREGLGAWVAFTGTVPHPEVLGLLRAADAFVSTSTSEAFGLAAAEAMALGLPVVVTDVGGHPELVSHDRTGLLVPPRDPAALADALERLHREPPLRRLLGEAASAHIEATLSPAAIASRWAAIYRAALSPPRP